MITEIVIFLNSVTVPVNFLCHLIIFVGTFYVAIHNRNIPQWHITPLWYLGLANLFVAITILVQWTVGPEHPLSYWNIGLVGESACDIILASIVLVMFAVTLRHDIINRKNRHHTNEY